MAGMKEKELREVIKCKICREPIGKSGLPLFFRVKAERHGIKGDVVKRQVGLEMVMGGSVALAQMFSPNEDMTEVLSKVEVTVCEMCCQKHSVLYQLFLPDEDDGE